MHQEVLGCIGHFLGFLREILTWLKDLQAYKDLAFQIINQFMPQTLFYFAANLDLNDKSKSKDPTSDIIQTHLTYRESG
jgi:hypothetical protein